MILPDVAVLDPELTLGLPPHVTAATGIDAMVHAIEAYASAAPNNNPLSDACWRARRCGCSAAQHREGRARRRRREARGEMLLGSMLAGQAFANSPVAAVHALAYPIGGRFHVPHGLSNALVLPHVLRFNAPAAAPLYAEIAADAVSRARRRRRRRTAPHAFIDALAGLAPACELEQPAARRRHPAGGDLPKLAADAMKQTRLLVNNPRAGDRGGRARHLPAAGDERPRTPPRRRADYRRFPTIQTRWADNDAYGHVNNTVYYTWFDTAVNAWLIEHGFLDIESGATINLVVETSCRYFPSLAYPGTGRDRLRGREARHELGHLRGRRIPPRRDRRRRPGPLRPRGGGSRDPAPGPDRASHAGSAGRTAPTLRLAARDILPVIASDSEAIQLMPNSEAGLPHLRLAKRREKPGRPPSP